MLADRVGRELFDDDQRWNAERAMDLLVQLWPRSQAALEKAVASNDAQARLLAARLLRRLTSSPSEALIKACVDDLRDDSDEVRYYLSFSNARAAADYLVNHGVMAEPYLAEAMRRGDRQQQILAAAVAGHAGLVALIDQAAPILIECLGDNGVRGDAKVAAPALYRFGPNIVPYLEQHLHQGDWQSTAIARAIIERITHPERRRHQLQHPLPHITDATRDLLKELTIGESASDL